MIGTQYGQAHGPRWATEGTMDQNRPTRPSGPLTGAVGMWPLCPSCERAVLLPLSDYGQEGASVLVKAWACSDSRCRASIRIDKGQVSYEVVDGRGDARRRA